MDSLLAKVSIGDKIFAVSSTQALATVRCHFAKMGMVDPDGYTWKAVRAGRATTLAGQGYSLHRILSMGEWKSKAILNYVDETTADSMETLRRCFHESSDEEDVQGPFSENVVKGG